jgi:HK97 family phage portal protein
MAEKVGFISKGSLDKVVEDAVKKSSRFGRFFGAGREFWGGDTEVTKPFDQIPSIYKAIKAIADNVPQADLKFRDKKSKKPIDTDPIIDLFNRPNPYMTESDFIQSWVGFHCLFGESLVVKEESLGQVAGSRNLPAELWPFNPEHFTPMTQGRLITSWTYSAESIIYKPEQVVFCKDFNPYSLFRGSKPLGSIEKIIDIDWKSLIYNKAFFDNDATPGLMLSTEEELGADVVKRIQAQFEAKYKGARNAHRVAILEAGLKPQPGPPTHQDMEFIAQKQFTREEILGIWRVPKVMFNITDDLNYATAMAQMKIFWAYGIMPVMKKIQASINLYIVQPYNPAIEAYFDFSNVVAYQEDFKEKVATGTQLWGLGFTRNEINERLGLGFEPAPWGDVWWAPFGLTPVDSAEEAQPEPTPPVDEPKKDASIFDQKRVALWKGFARRQDALEAKMSGAVSKYFFQQRKDVLAALDKQGPGFQIDWQAQDKKLRDKAEPYLWLGLKQGVEHGRSLLGKKSLSEDQLDAQLQSFLVTRCDNITQINQTVQGKLRDAVTEGVQAGETNMQLADRIREIYNMAAGRSILIARTETVGAVNGGSSLYYKTEGIQKKEWLTARDANVRETHQHLEGEVVAMSQDFSNGLSYPGDQKGEPEEVCNCRCTILPVVDK